MNTKDEQRFWEKVDKSGECWEWTAGKRTSEDVDYGKFYYDGKQHYAHRISYKIRHGHMPEKYVLHQCDNKLCVNPDHLEVGDQQQNVDEALERGRINRGEDTHAAKLSSEDVNRIKELYSKGNNQSDIAEVYDIDQSTVSKIVNGERWSHR